MNRIHPTILWILLAASACSSPGHATARPALDPPPALEATIPSPPIPFTMNGASRLVYELELGSLGQEPVRLAALRVLNERGTLLREWRDSALTQIVARAAPTNDPLALGRGENAVIFIGMEVPADSVPRLLTHEVEYARGGERATIDTARATVRREAVPVLGSPVRGGPWVAVYHPAWPRGHRRVRYTVDGVTRIPGRHAIDWIRVDENGRTTRGDPDLTASWLGHNAEVLAVADAVVVAVRDDVAESARISAHPDHPIEDATGNYIALALGDGRFAFYEHLAPNRIRVRVGEHVRRGQVIAAVGFTGHTTGPHLHFHVADANAALGAEGVPFVLECFDVRGQYEDLGGLGERPWRPFTEHHERERPAPNTVMMPGC